MSEKYVNIEELFDKDFKKTVDNLFQTHYTQLCRRAYRIVNNEGIAEDIVQDVFFKLWERRYSIEIKISLEAYLNRMVFNESISYLRKHKDLLEYSDGICQIEYSKDADYNINNSEIKKTIEDAIKSLPLKCRNIFVLSKMEELSYKEIAALLNISVKTVENQMGKALKILRAALKHDYLLFLLYFHL